jgi:flavin-dependent dehydrogenase
VALERHRFPRDKVCGDALVPDACRALERLGLFDRVRAQSHAVSRVLVFSPSGIALPVPTNVLVARRGVFDALLAEAAVEAGAVIANARVAAVATNGDRATVALHDGGAVRARIVLLATGADVRLLLSLGMVRRALATSVALRFYMRSRARHDDLILAFHRVVPRGYAWIFPLGDGEYNIGCGWNDLSRGGANLRAALDAFLDAFPIAREIRAAEIVRTAIGGATLRTGLSGAALRHPPNVLAIGETIGATFPLTGEGIGKTMETAERAAVVATRAIATGDLGHLDAYEQRIDALRYLYDGYAAAERWLARPWLNDLIARLVRRSPSMQQKIAGILQETVDPREVFSLPGVWNMLTRDSPF